MKRFLFLWSSVILCTCLVSCSSESNTDATQTSEIKAAELLEKVNSLDKQDLRKINTRGCTGNCWPKETAYPLVQYLAELEGLGYYVEWNHEKDEYSLAKQK